MRISDWSSDVFSSDLRVVRKVVRRPFLVVVVVDPESAIAGGKGDVLPGVVENQSLDVGGEVRNDAEAADVAGQTGAPAGPPLGDPARAEHRIDPVLALVLAHVEAGRVAPLQFDVYVPPPDAAVGIQRSEEHTSELQSLMRNSYAV